MNAKARVRLLNEARRRLGQRQVKKELVWKAAAKLMGSPGPASKADGYAFLEMFLRTNHVAPVGTFVEAEPLKAKPLKPSRISDRALARLLRAAPFVATDAFLATFEWRQMRMIVLKKRGARCECCGARPPDVRINVDHIKPRRTHPELALVEANLQVLCEDCNHGKGSWDQTDWRAPGTTQGELTDSPVPGTATATSIFSSVAPRLVRRR